MQAPCACAARDWSESDARQGKGREGGWASCLPVLCGVRACGDTAAVCYGTHGSASQGMEWLQREHRLHIGVPVGGLENGARIAVVVQLRAGGCQRLARRHLGLCAILCATLKICTTQQVRDFYAPAFRIAPSVMLPPLDTQPQVALAHKKRRGVAVDAIFDLRLRRSSAGYGRDQMMHQ